MTLLEDESNFEHESFTILRRVIDSYHPLSDETWQAFSTFCRLAKLNKSECLYPLNKVPSSFAFVVQGLFRAFAMNEKGNEYNKNFFVENTFPGAMTALLTNTPSKLAIEALEDAIIIKIDFKAYRTLLMEREDLKIFQILYLEKNWLLEKEAKELEIVQEEASERYQRFLTTHHTLCDRLPQYHVALYLGITPTQLSRIRKKR